MMRAGKYSQLLVLIATAFFCAASGYAGLDPQKAMPQYIHDAWGAEAGLPQNSVVALAQTPDNYLWLGTEEGLVRFDGVLFSVFNRNNTPQIGSNLVLALLVDHQGTLWIGTGGGGLVQFKDGRFKAFTDATDYPMTRCSRSTKTAKACSGSAPMAVAWIL